LHHISNDKRDGKALNTRECVSFVILEVLFDFFKFSTTFSGID
jgi:hypothetical protein